MTEQNSLQHSLHNHSLGNRAFQGACIAVVLATVFLSIIFSIGGVLNGKNFWLGIWEFFPLVTGTVAGALGDDLLFNSEG